VVEGAVAGDGEEPGFDVPGVGWVERGMERRGGGRFGFFVVGGCGLHGWFVFCHLLLGGLADVPDEGVLNHVAG
jgi:hypothetical protein